MTWCSLSRFLAHYLGMKPPVTDGRIAAMWYAEIVINEEPELTPYVLQAVSEAY